MRQYQSCQLKDVYSFVLEGKVGSAQLSVLYKMDEKALRQYLGDLKRTNPDAYGYLAFSALAEPQTRDKVLAAIA